MAILQVRVHPRARRDAVGARLDDGSIQIEVTAAPEGGRANDAVCAVLAETLGVRAREVRVVRGAGSRRKVIEVDSLADDELAHRLEQALRARRNDAG